jgi:hypothetical protein
MPAFVAKPVTVEAFQWRGVYADLPHHAARIVELQGYRPPIVHIGDGTKVPMEEGSWLIIGTDGRPEVLTNGAFERRYEPAAAKEAPERPLLRLNTKERVKA